MKTFLLTCALLLPLALGACDDNKQEARDRATNANNEIEVPAVAGDTTQTAPAAGDVASAPVVNTAMTNTPVPADTPSMQNTPAPMMETPAKPVEGIAVGEPNPSAPGGLCGANQDWVGKTMKDVDLSQIHNPVRTYYTDQPVTMDYSAQRLNFVLERGTDKILEVKCG